MTNTLRNQRFSSHINCAVTVMLSKRISLSKSVILQCKSFILEPIPHFFSWIEGKR